ncbi:hypothetical protein NMY22_g2580 [Coprinellus aureogranulatus]|nr:hypothetical protein NMY22_g2580 [Coprinellus aureogranulatus]
MQDALDGNIVTSDVTAQAGQSPHKRVRGIQNSSADDDYGSPKKKPRVWGKGLRGKSKQKILTAIFDIPFDLLYEIFSHLDAKDLLSLARTNKDFRRAVVNSSTAAIWREARKVTGALPPPPGVSEAKWTSFLFTSYCHSCGAANSYTEYITNDGMWNSCSLDRDFDSERFLYVPYTLYPAQHTKGKGTYRLMYKPDATSTEASWRALKHAVEAGGPRAAQEFEDFKRERQEFVNYLQSNAPQLRQWASGLEGEMWAKNWVMKSKYLELIKERFYALGTYKECDIDMAIGYVPGLRVGTTMKLTEKAWQKYLAKFEPAVQDMRKQRHEMVKRRRVDKVRSLLTDWHKSLDIPTSERMMYPGSSELYCCPEMVALLALDCDLEDLGEHYQPIINAFPRLSAEFVANRRKELRNAIPASNLAGSCPDPLELATSTFRPPLECATDGTQWYMYKFWNEDVVVGWKALSICHFYHAHNPPRSAPCEFDFWLSGVCSRLLTACGLDPHVTTVDKFDEVDERFLCFDCVGASGLGTSRRGDREAYLYTWRTAVSRDLALRRPFGDSHWLTAPFDQLSHAHIKHKAEGTVTLIPLQKAIKREGARAKFRQILNEQEEIHRSNTARCRRVWWCNHCQAGDHNYTAFEGGVVDHLRASHGIDGPTVPHDYFMDERDRKWYERPCKLVVQDGELQILPGIPPSEEYDVRYRR